MPSRPFPPCRPLPRRLSRWGRRTGLLLTALLLTGALACSSAPPPPAPPSPRQPEAPRLRPSDESYLLSPLKGFGEIGAEPRADLERGWHALLERSDLDEARKIGDDLLTADSALSPAAVLLAQADFVDRDYRAVLDRLQPVVIERPAYVAAQLVLGRAAELLGDVPLAYASFRAIASKSPKAFERTGELHPRTLEILYARLEDALAKRDLEVAERQLALLRQWGGDEPRTLEGERAVAVARGDMVAELAAVRGLTGGRGPIERPLLERLAELEIAVGDPRRGLEIFQGLADRYPRDAALADKLAMAKFRWRLTLLPKGVQDAAAKPELSKGDFAALLYWLVPNVRYARVTSGRIATDVLDHPQQEAIVRVVNLGLLDIDSTLHRFYPGAPLRRGGALRAVSRLLAQFGGGLSCLAGAADSCSAMAACKVIAAPEDCRANTPLSGIDAVEMLRHALSLLVGP
jgi:tetratricopeptide (TPR) repeat protein